MRGAVDHCAEEETYMYLFFQVFLGGQRCRQGQQGRWISSTQSPGCHALSHGDCTKCHVRCVTGEGVGSVSFGAASCCMVFAL